jgi:hypothetical protein
MRSVALLFFTYTALFGQAFDKTVDTPYGPVVVHFAEDRLRGLTTTVTNNTNVRFSDIKIRTELIPEKGKPRVIGLGGSPVITAFGVDPGQTKEALGLIVSGFRMKNATANVSLEELQLWADYRFESKGQVRETSDYKLTAAISPTGIEIEVVNKTQNPIEIIWDESSFIDYTGNAGRVMHSGVKYNERDQHQPNTVIPPGAKIQDKMTPTSAIRWSDGTRYTAGSWTTDAILPMQVSYKDAEKVEKAATGAELTGYLRLLVNGNKVGESLKFKVAEASATRKLDFFKY